MISTEENERLTRVGPGTPMGGLLRWYWHPVAAAAQLDENPVRKVRILGEDLVLYRDRSGGLGLVNDHCAHRGTSLSYGRNEEGGLTCIYHGWKFDVEGNVLETPGEPPESEFKKRIHHTAYPTKEAAGIVFAYMGPKDKMPLFPNYEWILVPKDHTYVTKCLLECNYFQGLEGELDSPHVTFLHRPFFKGIGEIPPLFAEGSPVYETEETDFGVRLVALRKAGAGKTYVRVSSFVMPVLGCVPARSGSEERDGHEIHIYVAADDTHTWRYDLGFRKSKAIAEEDKTDNRAAQIGPNHRLKANVENRYLQDREAQRTRDYTGIEGFLSEDACATETMGPIYNRSREHLGVADKGIIAVRKFLLNAIQTSQERKEPPHLLKDPAKNSFPHVASHAEVMPADMHWRKWFPHLTEPNSVKEPAPLASGSR